MLELQGGMRSHIGRCERDHRLGMRGGGGVSDRKSRRRRACVVGIRHGRRGTAGEIVVRGVEVDGEDAARARGTHVLGGGLSAQVETVVGAIFELRRYDIGLGKWEASRLHRWLKEDVP